MSLGPVSGAAGLFPISKETKTGDGPSVSTGAPRCSPHLPFDYLDCLPLKVVERIMFFACSGAKIAEHYLGRLQSSNKASLFQTFLTDRKSLREFKEHDIENILTLYKAFPSLNSEEKVKSTVLKAHEKALEKYLKDLTIDDLAKCLKNMPIKWDRSLSDLEGEDADGETIREVLRIVASSSNETSIKMLRAAALTFTNRNNEQDARPALGSFYEDIISRCPNDYAWEFLTSQEEFFRVCRECDEKRRPLLFLILAPMLNLSTQAEIETFLESGAGEEFILGCIVYALHLHKDLASSIAPYIKGIESGKINLGALFKAVNTNSTPQERNKIYDAIIVQGFTDKDGHLVLPKMEPLDRTTFLTLIDILPSPKKKDYIESLLRDPPNNLQTSSSWLNDEQNEDIATLFAEELRQLIVIWKGLEDPKAKDICEPFISSIFLYSDDAAYDVIHKEWRALKRAHRKETHCKPKCEGT